MCSSEKVLLARQKVVTSQFEELRDWIFGDHATPYLEQYSAMAKCVTDGEPYGFKYFEDYHELERLESNMNKQFKIQCSPKSTAKLARLKRELLEISNQLYYIEMDKESRK